ncbi:ParA family protein [Candidatus Borkfalkia ceftriaxoniphila]|jgi:sporulation initiation inhibitor protein Soj|uniref:Sporulation initiation inhibitor protein Soj n=1 Tax=Candidatus Borkfalkia ceftriaxoniphila TaxID=2508949 RepID=A0A4Q2KCG8_9FIRM|nr:AAA family ATPase [Candidatus Borkfalkia ceftriaxoniphila]RXZ61677.1 ParA family protein [Candidatus Borkfalkia ceftriaxoniphila]
MGKIVSFSNQKGGVGKTTTCVNMAAYIAAEGKKVLLVDMDPQGNATTGLGFSKSSLEQSIYSVLIDDEKALENIMPTEVENLDLLPSNIDLAGAEVELVYKKNRERVLKNALEEIRSRYDYILIDCPPSLGLLTINALACADSVIIPIQSEYYALEGLSQLMNSISLVKQHLNAGLEVDGVVLTMYDSRSLISKQIAEEIKKFFTKRLFEIVVPRNVRLVEASSYGKPIMMHDPKCTGARAYKALTLEYLARQSK